MKAGKINRSHHYRKKNNHYIGECAEKVESYATAAVDRDYTKEKILRITPEVTAKILIWPVGTGNYRGEYTLYAPPNKRQKRENKGGLGSPLGSPIKGKTKVTQREAYVAVFETIISNKKLHQQIIDWYDRSFLDHDVSVQTFLIRFWDEITKLDSCNKNQLKKYFLNYATFVEELCTLSVKNCTSLDIHGITITLLRKNYENDQIISMLRSLKFVFRFAKILGLYARNPVIDVLAEYTEHQALLQQLRNALVVRSFSREENRRLLKILEKYMDKEPGLVIGTMIRWLTGMTAREVAPLKWADIVWLQDVNIKQILVYKEFETKGTTAHEMDHEDLYRIVPCCLLLREKIEYLEEFLRETFQGKNDAEFAVMPVVALTSNPEEHITPDKIVRFGNRILQELNLEHRVLMVTNSKGEKVTIDLSKYQGDWFRSNFDYQARQVVEYLDDINYALGRRLNTTAARHYRDYTKPSRQLAYSISIDIWAETLRPGSLEVDSCLRLLKIGEDKVDAIIPKTCLPTESEFLFHIPRGNPDETLEMNIFMRFGGSIVAYEKTKGR